MVDGARMSDGLSMYLVFILNVHVNIGVKLFIWQIFITKSDSM